MIGEKIKKLRTKKNMTQEEVANLLYVTPQAISKWENNISVPDINFLVPIADLFNVSVDYLLKNTNNSSSNMFVEKCKEKLSLEYSINQEDTYATIEGAIKNDSEYNLRSVESKVICFDETGRAIDAMVHHNGLICAHGETPFFHLCNSHKKVKKVSFEVTNIKLDTQE